MIEEVDEIFLVYKNTFQTRTPFQKNQLIKKYLGVAKLDFSQSHLITIIYKSCGFLLSGHRNERQKR